MSLDKKTALQLLSPLPDLSCIYLSLVLDVLSLCVSLVSCF